MDSSLARAFIFFCSEISQILFAIASHLWSLPEALWILNASTVFKQIVSLYRSVWLTLLIWSSICPMWRHTCKSWLTLLDFEQLVRLISNGICDHGLAKSVIKAQFWRRCGQGSRRYARIKLTLFVWICSVFSGQAFVVDIVSYIALRPLDFLHEDLSNLTFLGLWLSR